MIVVKNTRGQRLGNLLFNIGMAYTIQDKLPNKPEIYCWQNDKTRTIYFKKNLKPIFFKDVKFTSRHLINTDNLTKVRGGGLTEVSNAPIQDNLFLTWYFQNCIELDIDLLRKKYVVPDVDIHCLNNYPEVFSSGKEVIGINVRRGDFLTFKDGGFFYINDIDFYKQALEKLDYQNKNLFIISDDLEWCKQNFSDISSNVFFSKRTDPLDNMRELMMCDYLILGSSSTFSAWASYLNTKKKAVVCSKKLYNIEEFNVHCDLMYPKDYIRI